MKKNFLNWNIFILIAVSVTVFLLNQINISLNDQVSENILASVNTINFNNATKEKTAHIKEELCIAGSFTAPLEQEIEYNDEISKNAFIKYLRRGIDDFLNKKYITDGCPFSMPGLLNGVHCEDSAYNPDTGPILFRENTDFLKGKFIVLGTDIAPGGGISIVLMFKGKPDEIFYAWVYSDSDVYYDLRGLSKYIGDKETPSMSETQQLFINQLCDEKMGI
jgi:hypothetical protein